MTSPAADAPEAPAAEATVAAPPHTGVPRVDAVLAGLAGLEDRPVSERVAVFEHAHQELRRALDHAADEIDATPGPAAGPASDPA